MNVIMSKSNEKVKYIKSLNDKKFRKKYHTFYVEGIKVVNEILNSKKAIDIMFIAYSKDLLQNINGGKEMIEKIENISFIEKIELSAEIFAYVTDTVNPQGVLIVMSIPKYDMLKELQENTQDLLILDQVQDLGNIGTIIRSADAFGIKLILCSVGTGDVYSPKVIRSTMGSFSRVKIIYVEDLLQIIALLKEKQYEIVGTSLQKSKEVSCFDFSKKQAFVVGNEANGVPKNILENCDQIIKIEMEQTAESLNVSVATSILLYENYIHQKNKNNEKLK